MVWRTSRFATFTRPRFPWKFNRPFYISRHLINWSRALPSDGAFSRKFFWSMIQVCIPWRKISSNFFPRIERVSRVYKDGVFPLFFFVLTSFEPDFDINDTFQDTSIVIRILGWRENEKFSRILEENNAKMDIFFHFNVVTYIYKNEIVSRIWETIFLYLIR